MADLFGESPSREGLFWATPPALLAALNEEFRFDCDPCPNPRPEGYDGLTAPWGLSNYVNPPFTGGVRHWVNRAILEHCRGATVVMVLPMFQERSICAMMDAGAELRWLGRVRWCDLQTGRPSEKRESELTPCVALILRGERWSVNVRLHWRVWRFFAWLPWAIAEAWRMADLGQVLK